MVQVITGHLVKSYDEEFRTLYARSVVPAELCPAEGSFPQGLPKYHSPHKIERGDHLRHSLDTVYRKTCERKLGARDFEERILEEEHNELGPLVKNGIGGHKHMPQFQSVEAANFFKRHSYAGERRDACVPENIWPRASNWNISRETGNHLTDNYLQVTPTNRGQNVRNSWNSNDKHILGTQQNMPIMENTSKSYMRSLRIESYLQNPDFPSGDSSDYLDQFEPPDKVSPFMQGRLRSSLVFRSTVPEQVELNRNIINSSAALNSTNTPVHYSSMQWNSKAAAENRMSNEELMFKRQSLQILDDNRNNATSGGLARNFYHPAYASLGKSKTGHMITKPDDPADSWLKRHSVADPRSNAEYMHETSAHMYRAFERMQVNRRTAGMNVQNGGFGVNLNEDQRSVSHSDVKTVMNTKSQNATIWQEPPSRTVSAAALHVNNKDLPEKTGSAGSRQFLKKSSKKIKSLLNIQEKKEETSTVLKTPSMKSSGSNSTLTAEDGEGFSYDQGEFCQKPPKPDRYPLEHQQSQVGDYHFKYSKPQLDRGSLSTDRSAERRIYSRYEPFYAADKTDSAHVRHNSYDKSNSIPRGEAAIEHNLTRAARAHHENKLGKFINRVGNLLHKNK